MSSKVIDLKCKAEILAAEIILMMVQKSSFQHATLGTLNYYEIVNALQKLRRKKRLKKFYMVGDFNFCTTNWETNTSTNKTEQMFIDEFISLGLIQCFSTSTHSKGNILDLVLTNSDNYISNIQVLSNQEACRSDHYAITFNLKLKIERQKPLKTRNFNFKRANWDQLNIDLNNVNWPSLLESLEPDFAWYKFKLILNHFMEIHIPIITIKHNSQPPWFHSECYTKCREKERLHKKFKDSNSTIDELKFVNCRRDFKKLIRSEMRDNLYCCRDNNGITKKFWAHVKSKFKSNRIPEVMKHKKKLSSNNLDKANMFNKYFFDQFFNSSAYDIELDFMKDNIFDINFSCTRRPVTPTQISKFEALLKNAIKWILNEEFLSYSDYNIYIKNAEM